MFLEEMISGDVVESAAFDNTTLWVHKNGKTVWALVPDDCGTEQLCFIKNTLEKLHPKPDCVIVDEFKSPTGDNWTEFNLLYDDGAYYMKESIGNFVKGAAMAGALTAGSLMAGEASAKSLIHQSIQTSKRSLRQTIHRTMN